MLDPSSYWPPTHCIFPSGIFHDAWKVDPPFSLQSENTMDGDFKEVTVIM